MTSESASLPPTSPESFEDALRLIERIVSELEDGNVGLEQSLVCFEQGIGLLNQCYRILEQAEQKIELLTGLDADGNPLTSPFDASATADQPAKPAGKPTRRRSASSKKSENPVPDEPPPDSPSDREDGRLPF